MKNLLLCLLLWCVPLSAQTTLVGSSKSNKYHRSTCRYAQRIHSANLVTFKTVEEAERAGYVACKVCNPSAGKPSSREGSINQQKRSLEPAASGRCQAITKKGTQCKRNARPGSKYCWQHGG